LHGSKDSLVPAIVLLKFEEMVVCGPTGGRGSRKS
jgi:hypothetical protein